MTLTQFLETEVLSRGTEFFGESQTDAEGPELRVTRQVGRIPVKAVLTALAAAALTVFTVPPGTAAATSARVHLGRAGHSDVAVAVPSLSQQQLRAVRLIRGAFEPIDPGLDATGEDPEYGF
jgi:hypothetical protein